ncbi:MAG: TIGR04282 family arsenosugar biosynthesis glycosyltransferase [Bacteroidota bacterium]|nr:TIGR04282 family arsenosugar biosynthesis glycosyltransferase [Bacteroidota bacterium]
MNHLDEALIIFIRNPILGQVKTRIGNEVGVKAALDIYLELLKKTRKITERLSCKIYLYYSEGIIENDDWNKDQYSKKNQVGDELGIRMKNAFIAEFMHHKQVIIIGSDCPSITPDLIHRAFTILQHKDLVIGPAIDGGYYLLGMNQPYLSLFDAIPWSTKDVLRLTLEEITRIGRSFEILEELSDIDSQEDWNNYTNSSS